MAIQKWWRLYLDHRSFQALIRARHIKGWQNAIRQFKTNRNAIDVIYNVLHVMRLSANGLKVAIKKFIGYVSLFPYNFISKPNLMSRFNANFLYLFTIFHSYFPFVTRETVT